VHIEPVTLAGETIVLEPLSMTHVEEMGNAALEPSVWRWIPTAVRTVDELRAYVALALTEQRSGVSLPFALRHRTDGTVIGSTRYANIVREHRRLEIGWTWIVPAYRRTAANTEMKLLLLRHAFETLGAHRVEFKTDALNAQSRAALLGIGATQEGIFRKHVVCEDGRIRDTVYFSIIDTEWPPVRARLEERLRNGGHSGEGTLRGCRAWPALARSRRRAL
jgi:RimJ/RimL family protein N-acetyltransferase